MAKRKAMDGNAAAAEGARLARVQVVAAYPITPQTPIVEKLASFIDEQKLAARYINVESEHSALCATIGASLAGTRAFTATASAGLALMHEITGVAAGCRLPIVMPIVNRALPSPWSLWCDHSDSMGERDQGWLQIYTENAQEALDFIIFSYRLAEDERVLLPVNVCLDGFFLSHTSEAVIVPSQEEVDNFLPPYEPKNLVLDPLDPMAVNVLTSPAIFTEIKHQHKVAMDNSLQVFKEVSQQFQENFGRQYGLFETYACNDAEIIIVSMGTMSGTVRHLVKKMRKEGQKVGALKLTMFRPFPGRELAEILGKAQGVAVIDRSAGLGSLGPLANEVRSSLYDTANSNQGPVVCNYVAGLGGRDVTEDTIALIIKETVQAVEGNLKKSYESRWIDLLEEAESI